MQLALVVVTELSGVASSGGGDRVIKAASFGGGGDRVIWSS